MTYYDTDTAGPPHKNVLASVSCYIISTQLQQNACSVQAQGMKLGWLHTGLTHALSLNVNCADAAESASTTKSGAGYRCSA